MQIFKFLVLATLLWLEVVEDVFGQTENEVYDQPAEMNFPFGAVIPNEFQEEPVVDEVFSQTETPVYDQPPELISSLSTGIPDEIQEKPVDVVSGQTETAVYDQPAGMISSFSVDIPDDIQEEPVGEVSGQTDAALSDGLQAGNFMPSAVSSNAFKIGSKTETGEKYHFQASQQFFYFYLPWNHSTVPPKKPQLPSPKLPAGYIFRKGIGAHKLHLQKSSWNTARKICIQEGGHLAVIRSDAEEQIVLQMIARKSLSYAWVGYHNKFMKGEWVTVFDEPLQKIRNARWSKKFNPNPSGDSTECGQLVNDGGLDDYSCTYEQAFICKISIK